jgi:hypothetical protein
LARVAELPPDEQDALAAIILEEIEDERPWAATFRASQDALARLADEARDERRRGDTTSLDRAVRD